MTSVGLEPQWYITQQVVFITTPQARCFEATAKYSPYIFLYLVYNYGYTAGLEPRLVHHTACRLN
jgi:hypothetical protein